jgi:hypothetical protein
MLASLCPIVSLVGCDASEPSATSTHKSVAAESQALVLKKSEIDLGIFFSGEQDELQCEFDVVNDQASEISLTVAGVSCGCSEPQLAATRLAPGESTSLRLRISAAGTRGPKSISCRVAAGNGEIWKYVCRFDVYEHLTFKPKELFLGQLQSNSQISNRVYLESLATAESKLKLPQSIQSSSDEIAVDIGEAASPELVKPGLYRLRTPIDVKVLVGSRAGSFRADIVAKASADAPKEADARLPIVWLVRSVYDLQPSRVSFGRVRINSGARLVKHLVIRSSDGSAFEVTKVSSSDSRVVCKQTSSRIGVEHVIEINFDPRNAEKFFFAKLVVRTDKSTQPELEVPISATVMPDRQS